IATAFNRLSVMSNESGSDPLEFRWAQVFDRVKTNATVFMGLTLECAQCHDHKYDPFSQKEFYQFASFFDNIDELGLFSRFSNGTPTPTTFVYKPGEEEEHRRLKQQITAAEKDFESAKAGAPQRFAEWLRTHAPPGQGAGLWTAILTNPAARPAAAPRTPSGYFSFDLIDAKEKKFMPDLGGGPGSSDNASQTPPEGKFGLGAGLPADKDKKYEFPGVAAFGRTDAFSFTFWLKMEAPLPRAVVLHRSRAGLDAANRGYELTLENGHPTATLAHFYPGNAIRIETVDAVDFKDWHHVGWTYDGSSKAAGLSLFIDGKAVATRMVRDSLTRDISYLKEWGDLDNIKVADAKGSDLITLQFGGRNLDKSLRGSTVDELKFYDCALTEPEMARSAGRREPMDEAAWLPWFVRETDAPSRAAATALHEARVQENTLATKLRDLMVMQEQPGPRRATTVLARGRFDSPADPVSPGTPAALSAWPAGATGDRLGLARWLTSPEHPLTSRVEVNRLWRLFFGRGLVATGHDFGIQGAPPTHPALLDWLAVRFRESGWNIKSLCREIVLSRTFRQSSTPADAGTLTTDPDNRWLARGPRLRLPGEQIRDAALSVSGLLVPEIGGPSVKPWQPDGLWEDSGTQHTYEMDQGPALHRRSLYTFWRRTCPPPMLSAFDAPSREFCLVQREESLTPLQTLAVLNDRAFLEAARALAAKTLESPAPDPPARVISCFQRATGTLPSPPQLSALTKLHNESLAYYQSHSADAAAFLQSSGSPAAEGPGVPDQAALMVVCRALFSSGEFLETW
ncbi:MAG: Planctomycete cytochrome, partial [Verrucomicrobiales bacterium]|nr:Planctomycete cytochrome [Verrucomicrobiales bacterium]